MATLQHKDSADIHLGAYVQAADPGAVGAYKLWAQTGVSPVRLWRRKADDSGWDPVVHPGTSAEDYAVGNHTHTGLLAMVGRASHFAASQNAASGTFPRLILPVTDWNGDPAALAHFTSDAALTGTVAVTNGSADVVGTGTLFTTELAVNQVLAIAGTVDYVRRVAAIADATHLTLAGTIPQTAAGLAATRFSGALIPLRSARVHVTASVLFDGSVTVGARYLRALRRAGNTQQTVGYQSRDATLADDTLLQVSFDLAVVAGDVLWCTIGQDSGGALDSLAVSEYAPLLSLHEIP